MKYKIENISDTFEKEAIYTLALAFVNDPGIAFFSPEPAKRMYHTRRMVKGMSGLLNAFGKKYMIRKNEKIVAVAMWVPPRKNINNWRLIKAGFFLIPLIMGLRVFRGIMKFLDIATRLQEEHMQSREHWHLFYLGVSTDHQGQGFGKAIISEILTESDKTNIPVFVQAFTEESKNFFHKNGFQIVSKTKFSEKCIMNCMIREPDQKNPERAIKDVKSASKKITSKPVVRKKVSSGKSSLGAVSKKTKTTKKSP